MARSSAHQMPALQWFFFPDRTPRSAREELLLNLQAQWMTLTLLESAAFAATAQEWAPLALYLVQFHRLCSKVPLAIRSCVEPLHLSLSKLAPRWEEVEDADRLTEQFQRLSPSKRKAIKAYQKTLENVLSEVIQAP